MTAKVRIAALMLIVLTGAALARAQEAITIRPGYRVGQQSRYIITASVETAVAPTSANGLSSNVRKELTATVLIDTTNVSDRGEACQVATIESISFRSVVNGAEEAIDASSLVGKKVEYTVGLSGYVLKGAVPRPAERTGLVELLFGLATWFPHSNVSVGQAWEANGQGPFYSDSLSEIAKGAKTSYKLARVTSNVALVEGAITLGNGGASLLSTTEGRTDINAIASGNGTVRFEFDTDSGRILSGATETRIEGKLSHIDPVAKGQPIQPRESSVVETSRFSMKLLN